ncbi:hypothetical protein N7513_003448 [Penicillium frequentans]|nr:hypothetical protein N7513_003448 [Penicillium glabrum]
MDHGGVSRPLDESLLRELPHPCASLRCGNLIISYAQRSIYLEPNTSGSRESNSISKSTLTEWIDLPTMTEFLNAARTEKAKSATEFQSNVEPLLKPILPAFVNLRALERFPFSSSFDDGPLHGTRKRRRLGPPESLSEHLQLPIPPVRKEQRPPPFGPFAILNGLNEPPPNAAILPPIEAGSISQLWTKPSREDAAVDPAIVSANSTLAESQSMERREARIEELLGATLDDHNSDLHDYEDERMTASENPINKSLISDEKERTTNDITSTLASEPLSPKTRGRSRKNLRKWTEEETNDLLRGVVKCGIGNWTAVLAQPELNFNKRTASNLKDRASDPNEATKQLRDNLASAFLKSQAETSDETPSTIRLPLHSPTTPWFEPNSGLGSPALSTRKPSTSAPPIKPETESVNGNPATRQSPSAKGAECSSKYQTNPPLGIPEPYVSIKSKRRSRRPFTTAEDEALLKGYAIHGFQWTLIQQDKRLNLSHRRGTDLRDRFRTKFPTVYRDGSSVDGNAMNSPATHDPGPIFRDRLPSTESTHTKAPMVHRRSDTHVHTRQSSNATNAGAGPFDPSLLPPPQRFVEPSGYRLSLSFGGQPTGPSSPWEDNTLAPMMWDGLGNNIRRLKTKTESH